MRMDADCALMDLVVAASQGNGRVLYRPGRGYFSAQIRFERITPLGDLK